MSVNRCHDCGVQPGQYHTSGCDMEPCPLCGLQAISCEHAEVDLADDCRIRWDGESVLHRAAVHLGFWCVFDPLRGWRRRPRGTPGATPDLNRVILEGEWDPAMQTWVKR